MESINCCCCCSCCCCWCMKTSTGTPVLNLCTLAHSCRQLPDFTIVADAVAQHSLHRGSHKPSSCLRLDAPHAGKHSHRRVPCWPVSGLSLHITYGEQLLSVEELDICGTTKVRCGNVEGSAVLLHASAMTLQSGSCLCCSYSSSCCSSETPSPPWAMLPGAQPSDCVVLACAV